MRRILVTGAEGFIGHNLCLHLHELGLAVLPFGREDEAGSLAHLVREADAIIHLAGENRPADVAAFAAVNTGLTVRLLAEVADNGRPLPFLFASSTQAKADNPYGRSKLAAEEAIAAHARQTGSSAAIFRLPGVFGKWCRPNYNSVVATFCHNIAHGLPIRIDAPDRELALVYIDDVVAAFLQALAKPPAGVSFPEVAPLYHVTLGTLAAQIRSFADGSRTLQTGAVGHGFSRALYATYVSNLPPERFSYPVPEHRDARGNFVEMLKTPESGQFSFLTAKPGITRGGHYHHTKCEKFLVVRGSARFRFRHLLTGKEVAIDTAGDRPEIVETIPGWAHDITNIGEEEMIVMLWASEIFDRAHPDTIHHPVAP